MQWQALWYSEAFGTTFNTTTGVLVEIIQFGFWNREPGLRHLLCIQSATVISSVGSPFCVMFSIVTLQCVYSLLNFDSLPTKAWYPGVRGSGCLTGFWVRTIVREFFGGAAIKRLSSWELVDATEKHRALKAELDRERAKAQIQQEVRTYER
jgi:hypothetical protein